jgi:hypothetical protein
VAILSRAVLAHHESSCGDNGAVYLSPRARDFLSGVFKEMSSRHASSADGKGRSVPGCIVFGQIERSSRPLGHHRRREPAQGDIVRR